MSSDSDDDIYGNIIKKRDKIFNNYRAEMHETKDDSFLEDCIVIDEKEGANFNSTFDLSLSDRIKTKRRGKPSKRGRYIDSYIEENLSEGGKTKRKSNKKSNPSKRGRKTQSKQNNSIDNMLNSDDSIIEIIEESVDRVKGTNTGKNSPRRNRTARYPHRPRNKRSKIVQETLNSLSDGTDECNDSDVVFNCDNSIEEIVPAVSSKKGRKTSRGRGRGKSTLRGRGTSEGNRTPRGRGTSTRKSQKGWYLTSRSPRRDQSARNALNNSLITYSVGNTEEYDDELENVPLFSSASKKNENISLDDTATEENEELSVKVYWQSIDIYRFNIRRFQKLKEIFDYFSEKENIPMERLLFTYNDRIIKQDDTPDSIDYNIAKFIDGGHTIAAVNNLTSNVTKKVETSGMKIKFQYPKCKKPFEVSVREDEKLSLAMTKCAEYLEIPLNKLKFIFDGDVISGSETLRDLDMEGDECIDVKIVN